jgi:flagellar basal-body rod modification protein FlgD
MTDPTGSSSVVGSIASRIEASRSRLADSEETFLKLLTTQLRNQDPLSPLDTTQFTQQLTQMTGVEQQIYGNQLLETLISQQGGNLANSVGLIGKTVTAQGDQATLSGGSAEWTYELPSAATDLTLQVLDASGRLVATSTPTDRTAGRHTFTWDGKNTAGQAQADGTYRLVVSARGADGQAISATSYVTGLATAIEYVDGQTLVTINGRRTPASTIIGVRSTPI